MYKRQERILLASQREGEGAHLPVRAYVVVPKVEGRPLAFRLVQALRDAGALAEMEQAGRSMKGQMKQADRVQAEYVVIAGDSLEVKDMRSGEQREVASLEDAVSAVTG